MLKKIISFVLSWTLITSQPIFAQGVAQINLGNYLRAVGNSVAMDKFRPLHMRYFSYDMVTDNFQLLLDKGDNKDIKESELEEKTKVLMDYFKIGLSLPNEKFWVNLRPDAQEQIIDPELEKTDIGRIMLEADLQLKKDTSGMTSPQTSEGKAYWDKLYKRAGELFGTENITIPTITRPWIVPGEIILRQGEDSAYIFKANMKVMLEEDYLAGRGGSRTAPTSQQYAFTDPRMKELNEYSTQLIRELIIPKLTKEVNTSKRYASLRQVFFSLVMARWFKDRYKGLSVGNVLKPFPTIDSGDLTNLTSKESWSKAYYFNEYKKSFEKGEYNLKEQVYTPSGQVIRSYVSGGLVINPVATGSINMMVTPMPDVLKNTSVSSAIVKSEKEIEEEIKKFKEKINGMANKSIEEKLIPEDVIQNLRNLITEGKIIAIIDTLMLYGGIKLEENTTAIGELRNLEEALEERKTMAVVSDVIEELYNSYKRGEINADEAVKKIFRQVSTDIKNKDELSKRITGKKYEIWHLLKLIAVAAEKDRMLYEPLIKVSGYNKESGSLDRGFATMYEFGEVLRRAFFVSREMYKIMVKDMASESTEKSDMVDYLKKGEIELALIAYMRGKTVYLDNPSMEKSYEDMKQKAKVYLENVMMLNKLFPLLPLPKPGSFNFYPYNVERIGRTLEGIDKKYVESLLGKQKPDFKKMAEHELLPYVKEILNKLEGGFESYWRFLTRPGVFGADREKE